MSFGHADSGYLGASFLGVSYSGASLPKDFLLALNRTSNDDGTRIVDAVATGDYEALPAYYLSIDPGKTITFSGMGAGVTLTSHSGTATVSLTSGVLSSTIGGTLFDIILSDGSTYPCGESAGTKIAPNVTTDIVGDLVGFSLPADRLSSVTTGHSWDDGHIVADGTGVFDAGVILNVAWDGVESGTTNPGTPKRNHVVTGFTGDWDGATYGVMDSSVNLSSGFRLVTQITPDLTVPFTIIGDTSNTTVVLANSTTGFLRIRNDNVNYDYSNIAFNAGVINDLDLTILANGDATVILNGISYSESVNALVMNVDAIGVHGAFDKPKGQMASIKIYDSSAILIHHWIVEGDPTNATQDTIYDIVGSNHATLTGATLPFFTEEFEGSRLYADGYQDDGTDLIPARADGLSAIGEPLTSKPGQIKDAPILMEVLPNMPSKSADTGLDFLFTGETPNQFTPTDVDSWVDGTLSDRYFYSEYRNVLDFRTQDLTDPVLTEVQTYYHNI